MTDYAVRSVNPVDGAHNATEIGPEQTAALANGTAIVYVPRAERITIDAAGVITHHDNARPQFKDAA